MIRRGPIGGAYYCATAYAVLFHIFFQDFYDSRGFSYKELAIGDVVDIYARWMEWVLVIRMDFYVLDFDLDDFFFIMDAEIFIFRK